MATDDVVYGLVLEFRLQSSAKDIQVAQLVCFDSCVYGRNLDTEHKRRHWQHYNIFPDRESKELSDRLPLMSAWIKESVRQYESAGFTMTHEPYPIQATMDEFQTELLKGDFPRNVQLRMERVRRDDKRPDPLDAV